MQGVGLRWAASRPARQPQYGLSATPVKPVRPVLLRLHFFRSCLSTHLLAPSELATLQRAQRRRGGSAGGGGGAQLDPQSDPLDPWNLPYVLQAAAQAAAVSRYDTGWGAAYADYFAPPGLLRVRLGLGRWRGFWLGGGCHMWHSSLGSKPTS